MHLTKVMTSNFVFDDQIGMCPICYRLFYIGDVEVDVTVRQDETRFMPADVELMNARSILNYPMMCDARDVRLHAQHLVEVNCDDHDVKLIALDYAIAPLIAKLNDVGMYTAFSCDGHKLNDAYSPFTIGFMFQIPEKMAGKFSDAGFIVKNSTSSNEPYSITWPEPFENNIERSKVIEKVTTIVDDYMSTTPERKNDLIANRNIHTNLYGVLLMKKRF